MNVLYLIGMPGSGKTTIGKQLAKKLKLDFHDMDHMIELFEGRTIPQIFEEDGEDYFRKIEKKVLNDTTVFDNAVVSTGGGVPCFFDNMEVIKKHGKSIYLKVSPKALYERVNQMSGRPLLAGKKEEELLNELSNKLENRAEFYGKADVVLESDHLTIEEVLKALKAEKWISDRLQQ